MTVAILVVRCIAALAAVASAVLAVRWHRSNLQLSFPPGYHGSEREIEVYAQARNRGSVPIFDIHFTGQAGTGPDAQQLETTQPVTNLLPHVTAPVNVKVPRPDLADIEQVGRLVFEAPIALTARYARKRKTV